MPPKIRSLSDLARMAGVSTSTASRALSGHWSVNDETKARVRALADKHGYMPNRLARNLRLKQTQSVGVLLPLGHETGQHLTDPFFLALLGHLADELVARGYDLVLSRVLPDRADWLGSVIDSGKVDGLIIIGQSDQFAAIEKVAERYAPMVVWGAALPGAKQLTVGSDNVEGGRLAAQHLIDLGRRRLLFAGNIVAPEFRQRLEGFMLAATAAGAGITTSVECLRMTFDGAYASLSSLLASGPIPDGIVAASDVVAISALRVLAERGLEVPRKVAVVGYDDVAPASHSIPSLTTIRQDVAAGAKLLVDLLIQRIEGVAGSSRLLPPQLVVRNSTVASTAEDIKPD